MKRLLIILPAILLILASCKRDPYADFITNKQTAEVGEIVYFTNRSMDANSYEWNFGDGYISYNFNASHHWDNPGTYRVMLTVFGKDGRVDQTFMDIQILEPLADLKITVLEFYDEYAVSGASVRLYPTVADWENETNMVVEGFTNSSGEVTFLDLPANRRYYVDAWEANHDNYLLAEEDVKWIETQILPSGTFNTFIAYVDYYEPGKKAAVSRKELKIIRSQTETGKPPRLRTDK